MELPATILNALLGILSLCIVYYALKIGHKTGFVRHWKYISIGFAAMAIGEFFLAYSVSLSNGGSVKTDIKLRDIGLLLMIMATALVLVGERGFSKSVEDLIGGHKHG